jgi:hypothetical protein
MGRSAGLVLRSQGTWGRVVGFRAGARVGLGCGRSYARFGPIPLRWAYGALREIGPALAEEARGRIELSRYARGALVIASKARSGPIPLRLGVFWRSARSVLRSLRRLWGGLGFRAMREGLW